MRQSPRKDKAEHEEERLSLYRDRERLNKELNRLANEKCWADTGAVNGRRSANAVQVGEVLGGGFPPPPLYVFSS